MASKQESDDLRQADLWEACASGELSQMVRRLDGTQIRARRKQVFSTALLSTAVFACLVFVVGIMTGPYGGIRCSYCHSHMAEYYAHTTGKIVHEDSAFVGSMKIHLEKCAICRGKFGQMYPDMQAAGRSPVARPVTFEDLQPTFVAMAQRSW